MTTTPWTLRDASGTPIALPSPAPVGSQIGLHYDDLGTVHVSAKGTVVAAIECMSGASAVTIVLTKIGVNQLDENKTSITRSPTTAPVPTWTNSTTGTTLAFTNPTNTNETSWGFAPKGPVLSDVAIALKVKVTVKRPVGDPRRS